MATTAGPDHPVGALAFESFRHRSEPPEISAALDDLALMSLPACSPQLSPGSHAPLPNPPFIFPAPSGSSSAPSSFSRATGRRSRSVVDVRENAVGSAASMTTRAPKPLALPAFSFPMAPASPSAVDSSFLSPPQSPQSPRTLGSRPGGHGHKRGGSEFVGGNIRSGDSITVTSTSPTQSESGLASPLLGPVKPSGRRGHAHRRSAAISSHDLAAIILPPPNPPFQARGSSAPTSPAVFDQKPDFSFPETLLAPEQSHTITSPRSEGNMRKASAEYAVPLEPRQQQKPPSRARVGFSDTLEFIPRPLSLVSSDTSSTATARPGHSLSGSISSVISLGSAAVVDREAGSPNRPPPILISPESRPSTAGPVLERTQNLDGSDAVLASPRRRSSVPSLGQLPLPTPMSPATPSPTKVLKRWSFFGLEPFSGTNSPTRSRPVSVSSSDSQSNSACACSPAAVDVACSLEDKPVLASADQKSIGRKRSKKQKKVKTWAGSILSRKSKPRHVKVKRRTPTPPLRNREDELESDNAIIETKSELNPSSAKAGSGSQAFETSARWEPRKLAPDADISFPMIDLDAALGPFNTPLPRNPEWEAAQRAGGVPIKRQLHSAAGMSRFTGPGMHYHHRRAESAPEMVPFEAARFGIHRFGSSSTMADVFEEDEEADEGSERHPTTGQSTPMAETPMEQADLTLEPVRMEAHDSACVDESASEHGSEHHVHLGVKRKGSDLSDDDKLQAYSRMKSEHVGSSLHEEVIIEECPAAEAFRFESPAFVTRHDSANSSPCALGKGQEMSAVELSPLQLPCAPLLPLSPYSMTQSSSFPSPRSPVSYDTQRISTAPSSIMTEDTFHSLLMGEPGPEVRISVDDVPSLTSSHSTTTRESTNMHNPQARPPPSNEHARPASFTSTAFGRRRSSLASLSRLISTSYGERSKLSMEVSLDNEPEKKPKGSRTKRLSRLVQFWRPKENAAS